MKSNFINRLNALKEKIMFNNSVAPSNDLVGHYRETTIDTKREIDSIRMINKTDDTDYSRNKIINNYKTFINETDVSVPNNINHIGTVKTLSQPCESKSDVQNNNYKTARIMDTTDDFDKLKTSPEISDYTVDLTSINSIIYIIIGVVIIILLVGDIIYFMSSSVPNPVKVTKENNINLNEMTTSIISE